MPRARRKVDAGGGSIGGWLGGHLGGLADGIGVFWNNILHPPDPQFRSMYPLDTGDYAYSNGFIPIRNSIPSSCGCQVADGAPAVVEDPVPVAEPAFP